MDALDSNGGRPAAPFRATDGGADGPPPGVRVTDDSESLEKGLEAVAKARAARLTERLSIDVWCSGRLHCIELRHGRLVLHQHKRDWRDDNPDAENPRPRCIEIRDAWRAATLDPAPGHANGDTTSLAALSPPLAWFRSAALVAGHRRRALSRRPLDGDSRPRRTLHAQLKVLVRLELARVVRLLGLRHTEASRVDVIALEGDRPGAGGLVWDLADDPTDEKFVNVEVRRNWYSDLWWNGLGVVDGRLVLDARRHTSRRATALVIDWCSALAPSNVLTIPGVVGSVDVGLHRDHRGLWRLDDLRVGLRERLLGDMRRGPDAPAQL